MEVKRTKTPEQALRALMNVCAKSERAISDVRRSLTRWGVAPEQHQPIIDRLVRERFIDEARYAEAYVREKLNLSRWGVRKIRAALKAKRIPEQTIDEALAKPTRKNWARSSRSRCGARCRVPVPSPTIRCAANCCATARASDSTTTK